MKKIAHQNFAGPNFLPGRHQRHSGAAGNVLIYVVVLMLIFGTLGVAMVSLFSTSTASTATSNDTRRARYLSEAGVRYAIGEMRKEDFDEDYIIDPLNTLTYTVDDAGTFKPNVFGPWFDSDASVDSPDVIGISPRLGEIPFDFTAQALTSVWVVNYDFITGDNPDLTTMRDTVISYSVNGTSLDVDITSDFVAGEGERVCLAVEPIGSDQDITEGGDLYVARDARFFFPPFNGAININRIDYAYARLVDDEDNSRVILENVTADQFPNTFDPFPSPPLNLSRGAGGSPYPGDFVILSPRNYMVMAEGTSEEVTWGNAYALGMDVYDDSEIRPDSRKPDITAEDLVTSLSQQESDTRFFEPNLTDFELVIGGGGTNQFGSAFYSATRDIGGERDYCQQGACLFGLGIRTYFLVDFTSQGDGLTFTLTNGADNRETSAGGDVDLPELMGYAGDSRTNSAGTTFLATAPEDRGLDPPKIAVEFDTRTNNDTLAYCNGASVNQNTRDDPLLNNQDAVQYVYWGGEDPVAQPCRSDPSYDDNRHGPGLWQFDDPGGKVNSSAAVDPSTGTIYIGSNDNNVYAINPDGTRKWVFSTPSDDIISSPAVDPNNGTIYVGSNDNNVYAINPATGSLRWTFTTGGDVRSSPAIASDGTIYVGSDDGILYALNSTQRQLGVPHPGAGEWQRPNPVNAGAAFSLGRPAIGSGGTIYVSDQVSALFAVRPTDGAVLWTYDLIDDNRYMPSVDSARGNVYTDVAGNAVAAINASTGIEKWRVAVGSDIDSTPVVGPDGTIYLGTDTANSLFAVTPGVGSGAVKWQFPTPDGGDVNIIPALSPDGSVVYAVSNGVNNSDGYIYAVDTATGTEKWSYAITSDLGQPPTVVTSSPVVDPTSGTIYVGSDDTSVYALTPFDEEPRNLQGLLLDSAAALGGSADSAVNWLNGAAAKGPWAVRLEVDRITQAGGEGDYELRLWMKQCDDADCITLNGASDPFFKDTRIIYNQAPNLVQFFQLDALDNAKFDRFLFGFTAAAGAQAQNVSIINFTQSFIRIGDPIITP